MAEAVALLLFKIPHHRGVRPARLHVMDRAGTFPAKQTATGQQYDTEADTLRPGYGRQGSCRPDGGPLPYLPPWTSG